MTNKELREEVNRLKTALAELGEKVDALPKSVGGGVFKPEDGQDYWSISRDGYVYCGGWGNHRIDHNLYSIGNCFPTQQAAMDAVRVLKLIQKARESQGEFVPDWDDTIEKKYVLYFGGLEGEVCVTNYRVLNLATTFGFWGDESECAEFIKDNYNELLWFFKEYRR